MKPNQRTQALLSLLVVFMAFGSLTVLAGDCSRPTSPFQVDFSTREVLCLAMSPDGLMVGTTGGLRRIGRSPQVDLPGVAIRAISPDGRWLATDQGLYRAADLRPVDSEPTTALAVLPSGLVTGHPRGKIRFPGGEIVCPTRAPIHSLAFDGEQLWAASQDGLWKVSPQGFEAEKFADDLKVTALLARPADDGGVVIMGTPWRVYRHAHGQWSIFAYQKNVTALAFGESSGKARKVLIGTASTGVWHHPESPSEVSALLWTAQGLAIGTPHQGAFLAGNRLSASQIIEEVGQRGHPGL